jgi:hypothetical protein
MSWIISEDDGDLYSSAKALGADDIVLATKRRTQKYLETKQASQGNQPTNHINHFPILSFYQIIRI